MKEPLIFGYLESWANPGITFTQAARNGYNAIVMAFGTINGSQVSIYDNQFVPSGNQIAQDIAGAKAAGARQIICSFGGGNNTYLPDNAAVDELAANIILFLKQYGFTGIDFDLEINTSDSYLDNLCAAIRSQAPDIIITGAPQINQATPETNLYLVTTAHYQDYQLAINNKRFDYLLVQAYNNPSPELKMLGESNVEFISTSFRNLKLSVPDETLIVIGEPAAKISAGFSIFTESDPSADIYQKIAAQYEAIKSDPQFGGAMIWNINQDAANNDLFIKSVKSLI
ncbi:glycosyl hydrolase family 18 protein [Gynuella sunshinyii]|uniref:Chitinase n=1 Tax=Gynuella sunshinyii YC6258 TaxID=1445510 RepID=A0A0C5VT44_9GAMM|nr:glycosyl hydrolase family 18 protein [Gynuella sunshinyii]AJQ97837.1 chitinase [Gynuella sunshinyii YC6258]